MTKYEYEIQDKSGALLSGIIDGDSKDGLIAEFSAYGYTVISVEQGEGVEFAIRAALDRFETIGQKEAVHFTRQVSVMLNSGLPLVNALIGMSEQTENRKFRFVIDRILCDVQEGAESF